MSFKASCTLAQGKGKTVPLVGLIVSTLWLLTPVVIVVTAVEASLDGHQQKLSGSYSNITILDLYPELKEMLWQKALSHLSSSSAPTEDYSLLAYPAQQGGVQGQSYASQQQLEGASWGYDVPQASHKSGEADPYSVPAPAPVFSRGGWEASSPAVEHGYKDQLEMLKYYQPFGPQEMWNSWKFKPSESAPMPAYTHPSPPHPVWEEEETDYSSVGYEMTKDFSCLAGILGLKTLKTLKLAVILKKLKFLATFVVAFKLGLFLSPLVIPLLFPVILLAAIAKILPMILIIVLLLKLLKKQLKLKLKKPLGKFLDHTSSLFFDEEIDNVTEKVLNSEECVDKVSCAIDEKSRQNGGGRRKNSRKSKHLD